MGGDFLWDKEKQTHRHYLRCGSGRMAVMFGLGLSLVRLFESLRVMKSGAPSGR